ncbi:MAG: UbiD family decarboxylase [Gammaproteobacteria bacterium]|nr:UbiD family decarboxylase [Gammaproteobacteria bacterium]
MAANKTPDSQTDHSTKSALDRREFLVATTGIAALTTGCATTADGVSTANRRSDRRTTPPYDSIRDWVAALDEHGLLLRIAEIDQDNYEATGLVFRMNDYYGPYRSPGLLFEKIKMGGEWYDGPVLGNMQMHFHTDSIAFGLETEPLEYYDSYREVKDLMKETLAGNKGRYPEIPPNVVARDQAPCKEVTLEGDDIDLTKFGFMQTNPHDDGRYVNTASIFTSDPEIGYNFGTYRCALRGPRKLGFNPEPNQTGYNMMMRAKERGEKTAPITLVLGQDPIVWMISGTKVALRFGNMPADELAIAGGFRGKALDVVKSDTNDMLIPAHAELIIEGEVPLDDDAMEPEGPFGEMFGYMGAAKETNFVINVKRVTHRKNPWLMNAFTGMGRGMLTAPMDALYEVFLKRTIPNIVEFQIPQYAMGVAIMSIDKQAAGEGMKAGNAIAKSNPIAKVVIVLDKDVNILDPVEVIAAIGARWQPYPASKIFEDTNGLFTDPSQVEFERTSKIVIDATRQLPGEGGKEDFPKSNRQYLSDEAPQVWDIVDEKFGALIKNWKRV